MKTDLSKKPLVLVDLNAGRWVKTKTGHECYNLIPCELDGRYYGYCPPHGGLNIQRLGASKDDSCIGEVVVVYTQKVKGSSDREIIAFTDDALILSEPVVEPELDRVIIEDGEEVHCSYCITSDNLYNLSDYPVKHIIKTAKYNPYLFRGQRVYKGTEPELDKEVINYLEKYLDDVKDEDSLVFQRLIQEEKVSDKEQNSNNWAKEPQSTVAGGSKAIVKDAHVSKLALLHAGYQCTVDPSHKTFMTTRGVPYMEGHHLIPCTYSNAIEFWDNYKRNIDCEENIVCVCPTCHRRVHFGSKEEKEQILKVLYSRQHDKLKSVGIDITLSDLMKYY